MKTQIATSLLWLSILLIVSYIKGFEFYQDTSLLTFIASSLICIKLSFFSCFWVFELTKPDMIFGFVRRFIESVSEWYAYRDTVNINQRIQTANWLKKPILTCEICTGCNFTFWTYILIANDKVIFTDLLFYLAFTSFVTILTRKIWSQQN